MIKALQIYTSNPNGTDSKFPSEDAQIELIDFSFSSSRMEIPTLTATIKHSVCLDSEWNYRQYIEFRGEKYWVSKIPSSSKDNTDQRYKHEITFISERNILTNIYFYDVVGETDKEKYHSESATVLFYGTLNELVTRINASLKLSGVKYSVVVDSTKDEDIKTKLNESKEFSCENAFVFDVLKQAHETWDIPFYFIGKVCHFGYSSITIDENTKAPLQYGADKSLLKIARTNANTRIITRATGVGSTDNIPFYYPNDSEKGNFTFETDIVGYEIIDGNKLATSVGDGVTYTYTGNKGEASADLTQVVVRRKDYVSMGDEERNVLIYPSTNQITVNTNTGFPDIDVFFTISDYAVNITLDFLLETDEGGDITLRDCNYIELRPADSNSNRCLYEWRGLELKNPTSLTTNIKGGLEPGGYKFRLIGVDVRKFMPLYEEYTYTLKEAGITVVQKDPSATAVIQSWWIPNNSDYKKIASLQSIGIDYTEDPPHYKEIVSTENITGETLGKKFTLNIIPNEKFVYQERLMPSIFTEGKAFDGAVKADSKGTERYYNAINNLYPAKESGKMIVFTNEKTEANRSEQIYQYDDIKPEIKGVLNKKGQLMCSIADIAYDDNDSDDTLGEDAGEDSNKYAHPYFYIKLHTTDYSGDDESSLSAYGNYGFNLFNRATEKDSMVIQMTSGNLNGCKFKVQVVEKGENVFKNPVQVDYNGNIVAGDKDKKISLSNFIDRQQDTRKNEVWIAVLKDTETYGIIMPNNYQNFKAKIGDTFNITGIALPKAYIIDAQKKLDEKIVADMRKENEESFNHSIEFSRIFLQEDFETSSQGESWVDLLNETVRIPLTYNGKTFYQYITSYSYVCKGSELLPQISIELSNTIAESETFEEKIAKKTTTQTVTVTNKKTLQYINNANFASNKALSEKAERANTLKGYGIEDAYIQDGTIVLGDNAIAIPRLNTVDWSQVANKPFEFDKNGDIKVTNNKGLYSTTFISARGKDDSASSAGMDVARMWEELAKKSEGNIIDESHIPDTIARKSDLESLKDNLNLGLKWNEVTNNG